MTVILHQISKTPIASIELGVKTGSATEGKFSGSGISHLVEHMLFKGGGEKNAKSYTERIKSLGGSINGFTSHDYTSYIITVPSEYIRDALEVLREIIASPAFDALELKKEKAVIFDEIRRSRDAPSRFALDIAWTLTFQEHPYKYPIIGYEDLFGRLEKSDLEEYYSGRYSPHNMVLAIAGDVDAASLFKDIDKMFGVLKRNFVSTPSAANEPKQLSRRYRAEYRPISLSHVILSYRSASINDASLYPLDIIATVLGEGEGSILTKELRDKRRYVNFITCRNYTLRDSGLFYIYFITQPEQVDMAVASILEELEKIKKNGIDEAELKKSMRTIKVNFVRALETAEGRAGDIATSELIAGDYNLSPIYLDKISEVTVEGVKSQASAYLEESSLNIVSVLPQGKGEEMAESLSMVSLSGRKIAKEILPNGMRVIICEDHSMPTCSILTLFLGGVRAENEANNGISHLVAKLFLEGTAKRSAEEIKNEIEAAGGSIDTISGNNSFGIMLDFLSEDWEKGIGIMGDMVMNSTFGENGIEKEKDLALAAIKERDDDIVETGLLSFRRHFFGEHPYRFDPLGTAESVQAISRNDILHYYNSLCAPANAVFAVIGDIDAEEVIQEVSKRFARFEKTVPKLPDPPASHGPIQKREISVNMEREQALIIVGFPGVKFSDNDRYVFEVIDSIMSGSNGRMFNIRDRLGMSYALGSLFQPGLEPGYHLFYALTSQENIKTMKDATLDEIRKLRDKTVPEEELEAAKRYLITSFMRKLQKNSALGLTVSLDELYGLGYKNYETYRENINNVTAGQIKRVMNQYFDTKNCLVVIISAGGKEAL